MSVLVLVDSDVDAAVTERPSDNNYGPELMATTLINNNVPVFAYRPGEPFLDAVIREFWRTGDGGAGDGVRLVLTGCWDPRLVADRLSHGYGVPVNVVHSTASEDWIDALWSADNVCTVTGWVSRVGGRTTGDDVADAIRLVDGLSAEYLKYVNGLRDVPSAAVPVDGAFPDHVVHSSGHVQAVELILDAILQQLCGAKLDEPATTTMTDQGRWTWATAVVEHGDRAAEHAFHSTALGQCSEADAADCARRMTNVATTFATAFWRGLASQPPTETDRVLNECLVDNLRAAAGPELAGFGAEQFSVCLNAKFADTRRWRGGRSSSAERSASRPPLFRPEIREPCERFMAMDRLTDLMTAGDGDGDSVFDNSHVQHLEPYVLPQILVEYASRYNGYHVRYFALTDTLVFRFTDGERGELIERSHRHRFAGPSDFKQYHHEVFRMMDYLSDGSSNDPDDLPLAVSDPNVFRYRHFGFVDAHDDAVQYVSTSGLTKVRAEVFRLFGTDDGEVARDRKYRMRVECDDGTWVAVNCGTTADGDRRLTELTVGFSDGTVVAVTRSPEPECRFDVTTRTADQRSVVEDRSTDIPVLEHGGSVATVTLADGTQIVAEYATPEQLVCEVFVSDGTRVRMLTDPTIQYFRRRDGGQPEAGTCVPGAKYLVCRRDLSGYEFVRSHGRPLSPRCTNEFSDGHATVVRTLTRSHFDGRTSGLLDTAFSVHLQFIGKLADQLNANFPDDRPMPPVTDT